MARVASKSLTSGVELSIVIPTFNERDNVAILVQKLSDALSGVSWECVFVDDDSPDGTSDVLRELAQQDARVRLIHRIGRRGLSSACVEGILATSAPFIAVMDADLQHDERILPTMLQRIRSEDFDLVVGSRYVDGGGTGEWTQGRVAISRFATDTARMLFKVQLKDPMSGFFVIRREAFAGSVRRLSQQGFKILFDLIASSPKPLKVAETPYEFRVREHGESKLDAMAGWQFVTLMLDKSVGRFVPLRFILFGMVGGSGVVISLATLYLFLQLGMTFVVAQTGAVITAMTTNFLLNNFITYRDRRLVGWGMLRGLLSFYLVCSIGSVANVGIASVVFNQPQQSWWLAGLAGAAIGAVWNYVATQLFTWRQKS